MPIFGDPATFAVEYEPVGPQGVLFAECHFTYWIGGQAVGNPELRATSCDLANSLHGILSCRHQRRDDQLFALSSADLIETLEAGLLGKDEEMEALAAEAMWAAHNITYAMDHGYRPEFVAEWGAYLVENEFEARLVYRRASAPAEIFEQRVPSGRFDEVLLPVWERLNHDSAPPTP